MGAINEGKKKKEKREEYCREIGELVHIFMFGIFGRNDEARFGSQFFVAHDSIIEIDFSVGMAVFQSRLLPFRAKIVPSLAKE